jgi:haloalkane dehalogenase
VRVLRTPDHRFAGLPGIGYDPRYVNVGDLWMAYVETGPADGEPVLLLHGEPSWSFLYRTVMPVLAEAGFRAIAPDLIGFGRSDKPAAIADHSYARHVEWVRAFAFDRLELSGLTLVGQDWGGMIGLRLIAEHPDRFTRVVAANTGLPTGDHPMPDVWLRFREVVRTAPTLSVSRLVQSGCQTGSCPATCSPPTTRAVPRRGFLAGPRAMPGLVPTSRTTRRRQPAARPGSGWRPGPAVPCRVQRPRPDHRRHGRHPEKRTIPGASRPGAPVIAGAGHFLQEDDGVRLEGSDRCVHPRTRPTAGTQQGPGTGRSRDRASTSGALAPAIAPGYPPAARILGQWRRIGPAGSPTRFATAASTRTSPKSAPFSSGCG